MADTMAPRTLPKPTMTPVKSSQLVSVGYDADTKTLAVEFKGGAIYHYQDVPASHYEGLLHAESKGKYLGQHIKAKDDKGAPKFKFTSIGQPAHARHE